MTDREKVLKALEHHKETAVCNGCPYAGDDDTPQGNCPVYDDALALLREQEAVSTIVGLPLNDTRYIFCGACKAMLAQNKSKGYKYCPWCGRAVKWGV